MAGSRQQILDAVKARFAQITTANQYQTDIGARQTEHHPTSKGADELPAHDVRDEVETTDGSKRNAGTYERALEDMERAVGVDPRWGGLARYSIPVESEVTVDDDGQLIGAARLAFDIIYDRAPWKP